MFLGVLGGAVCGQSVLVTMATDLGHSLASGSAGVGGVWRVMRWGGGARGVTPRDELSLHVTKFLLTR